MNGKKKLFNDCYNKLASEMDKRDNFMMLIKDYYIKHGEFPEKYKKEGDIFRKEGFKSWRAMPSVRKRIIKAAKIKGKK